MLVETTRVDYSTVRLYVLRGRGNGNSLVNMSVLRHIASPSTYYTHPRNTHKMNKNETCADPRTQYTTIDSKREHRTGRKCATTYLL